MYVCVTCVAGSCPQSAESLILSSDLEVSGKVLEANGPSRHCHGEVDSSGFYKLCLSDLYPPGGLRSLAWFSAVVRLCPGS